MTRPYGAAVSPDPDHAFSQRLDAIGWALFLILTGGLWLIPEAQVPPGMWFIGTGLLLLALNAIRASRRVPVSGLGTLLGVLALIAGLSAQWAVDLPLVAICLVVLGFGLLLRQFVGRA